MKITRVAALDNNMLDIELSGGSMILLNLGSKLKEQPYIELVQSGRICRPSTDGRRIFWRDGPSLTLDEIIKLLYA